MNSTYPVVELSSVFQLDCLHFSMDLLLEVHVGARDMSIKMAIRGHHVDSVWSHSGALVSSIAVADIILTQILIFGIILWALYLFS